MIRHGIEHLGVRQVRLPAPSSSRVQDHANGNSPQVTGQPLGVLQGLLAQFPDGDDQRFLQQVEISDEAVAAEYQAHPDRYMNPESVDLEYVEIRLDDIIPEVTVTEQDLREFYDIEFSRDPQMFSVPEQRRARHILVAIDDDTDEGEALEEAQVLAERVKGGEDFAAVAREASDDS